FYSQALGGDYDYLLWVFDARQYIRLYKEHVLALQLLSEFRTGAPPFSSMAELGGPNTMRGYFRGRYRDNSMIALQSEYRFPIYWRFSGALFANVAETYSQEAPFQAGLIRWTLGAGVRLRFGSRTYMRVDGGGGKKTGAVIFGGGQAY
ncbi:MAG: BamA/TamA family outer membrane protein, partial [Polyangiaceae bacterium]|nr:BamA/TamA family outer membrane protein [Polyangiaceae bacterium]